jgi:hypothetical protein
MPVGDGRAADGHAAEETDDGRQGFQECSSTRLGFYGRDDKNAAISSELRGRAPGQSAGPARHVIGDTQCRIHGTNDSIDKKLSSVRVTDDDVVDVNGRMSSRQAAQPGAVGSVVGLY